MSMQCGSCGKTYRPLRQTAQPMWTSPPTRPEPPPSPRDEANAPRQDIWANDYLRKRERPILLPGQQAGRTAQGMLTLGALIETSHAVVACLMWQAAMGTHFGFPRDSGWGVAGGGCLCLLFVFSVMSGIFFLMWLGHSYANLPSLGATGLRFHPALVVLGFFIPIVNLVLPYIAMQELWRASAPADADGHWSDLAGSKQITIWWTFWILSALSYLIILGVPVASEFLFRGDWIQPRAIATVYGLVNILGSLFTVAANILLIGVIEDIIQRQSKKYVARRESGDDLGPGRMADFAD